MTNPLANVDDQVAKVADRLADEYADRVPAGVVRGMVTEAYTPIREARVKQFVPVLVDRSVRQRLRST
jgi:F420-0:gamma-glutamyl ligase